MNEMLAMQGMTTQQQMMFQSEMGKERKSSGTALLLCFLFGGIGAHRFYLGQIGQGMIYLLLCWTLIPGIVAFIELFTISGQVDKQNAAKAQEISATVRLMG